MATSPRATTTRAASPSSDDNDGDDSDDLRHMPTRATTTTALHDDNAPYECAQELSLVYSMPTMTATAAAAAATAQRDAAACHRRSDSDHHNNVDDDDNVTSSGTQAAAAAAAVERCYDVKLPFHEWALASPCSSLLSFVSNGNNNNNNNNSGEVSGRVTAAVPLRTTASPHSNNNNSRHYHRYDCISGRSGGKRTSSSNNDGGGDAKARRADAAAAATPTSADARQVGHDQARSRHVSSSGGGGGDSAGNSSGGDRARHDAHNNNSHSNSSSGCHRSRHEGSSEHNSSGSSSSHRARQQQQQQQLGNNTNGDGGGGGGKYAGLSSMDDILHAASSVRGLRLSWVMGIIVSLMALVLALLLTQMSYSTKAALQEYGTELVDVTSLTLARHAEMMTSELTYMLQLLTTHARHAAEAPRGDTHILQVVCAQLYRAATTLAFYDATGLTWQHVCDRGGGDDANATPAVPPPSSLPYNAHTPPPTAAGATSTSVMLARHTDTTHIAYVILAYHTDESSSSNSSNSSSSSKGNSSSTRAQRDSDVLVAAVMLDVDTLGRVLFGGSELKNNAATLVRDHGALMLPHWHDAARDVAVHSLAANAMRYSAEATSPLAQQLRALYGDICRASSPYVWDYVVNATESTAAVATSPPPPSPSPMTTTLPSFPLPFMEFKNDWGLVSRVGLCGVMCARARDDDDDATTMTMTRRCVWSQPTSLTFVVETNLRTNGRARTMVVVAAISVSAVLVFTAIVVLTYLSVTVPVYFLRLCLLRTVGLHSTLTPMQQRMVRWTRRCWLSDVSALIRAIRILSLCYRLNKKYVPQHVLRHRAAELVATKGEALFDEDAFIDSAVEESHDDDDDDDVDVDVDVDEDVADVEVTGSGDGRDAYGDGDGSEPVAIDGDSASVSRRRAWRTRNNNNNDDNDNVNNNNNNASNLVGDGDDSSSCSYSSHQGSGSGSGGRGGVVHIRTVHKVRDADDFCGSYDDHYDDDDHRRYGDGRNDADSSPRHRSDSKSHAAAAACAAAHDSDDATAVTVEGGGGGGGGSRHRRRHGRSRTAGRSAATTTTTTTAAAAAAAAATHALSKGVSAVASAASRALRSRRATPATATTATTKAATSGATAGAAALATGATLLKSSARWADSASPSLSATWHDKSDGADDRDGVFVADGAAMRATTTAVGHDESVLLHASDAHASSWQRHSSSSRRRKTATATTTHNNDNDDNDNDNNTHNYNHDSSYNNTPDAVALTRASDLDATVIRAITAIEPGASSRAATSAAAPPPSLSLLSSSSRGGRATAATAAAAATRASPLASMRVRRDDDSTLLYVRFGDMSSAYVRRDDAAARRHYRLLRVVLQRVRYRRGAVFQCSGDGVAAAWNAFDSCPRHAEYAARCAQDIANAFARLRADGLHVGIVLHQGVFVCGTLEVAKDAFVTAFGDAPRQLSALAELAAMQNLYHVLVTEPVKQALSSQYECNIVDVLVRAEQTHPSPAQPLPNVSQPSQPQLQHHHHHHHALQAHGHPLIVFELGGARNAAAAAAAANTTAGAGVPSTHSAFAVAYAKVFSHFRNHRFDEVLRGVAAMRERGLCEASRTTTYNEGLLARLELLSRYYACRPGELPLPYHRAFPHWCNYELTALNAAVAAAAAARAAGAAGAGGDGCSGSNSCVSSTTSRATRSLPSAAAAAADEARPASDNDRQHQQHEHVLQATDDHTVATIAGTPGHHHQPCLPAHTQPAQPHAQSGGSSSNDGHAPHASHHHHHPHHHQQQQQMLSHGAATLHSLHADAHAHLSYPRHTPYQAVSHTVDDIASFHRELHAKMRGMGTGSSSSGSGSGSGVGAAASATTSALDRPAAAAQQQQQQRGYVPPPRPHSVDARGDGSGHGAREPTPTHSPMIHESTMQYTAPTPPPPPQAVALPSSPSASSSSSLSSLARTPSSQQQQQQQRQQDEQVATAPRRVEATEAAATTCDTLAPAAPQPAAPPPPAQQTAAAAAAALMSTTTGTAVRNASVASFVSDLGATTRDRQQSLLAHSLAFSFCDDGAMVATTTTATCRQRGGGAAAAATALPSELMAKNGTLYLRSDRLLGRGSFGSVYLGMDSLSGKLVAIKYLPLPADETEMSGIEAEVMIMQRVKDAHVVEFITYAFQNDRIVFVMECMMAGSLQRIICEFRAIPSPTARVFTRDVLRGLATLHAMDVIHRDVKPQNVLLSLAGNCKISDFGASALVQQLAQKEYEGTVTGTPAYLAPEAAQGKPVKESDIWSCGVMFLQMLTGKLPYSEEQLQRTPAELVYQIGAGIAVPTVPGNLDELDAEFVHSCLQADPRQRKTAQDLLCLPLFAL